jgi:hypothetical protein
MLEEAATEVAEGAISYQTSTSVMSPFVVRSLARVEFSGGCCQEMAQALVPMEGMRKRIMVESFVLSVLEADKRDRARNAHLDSHINLHPISPHRRLQLPANPYNSVRPGAEIVLERA